MWKLLLLWQVFLGNTNPTDVVKTPLPKPTLTRFIRIRPYTWETGIALRFEVYGCKISGGFQGCFPRPKLPKPPIHFPQYKRLQFVKRIVYMQRFKSDQCYKTGAMLGAYAPLKLYKSLIHAVYISCTFLTCLRGNVYSLY